MKSNCWDFEFFSVSPFLQEVPGRYLLTLSLRPAAGVNLMPLEAGICVFSPVLGFLPSRAARFTTLKLPKPVSEIESPFSNAEVMPSNTALTASPVDFLVMSALYETNATKLPF